MDRSASEVERRIVCRFLIETGAIMTSSLDAAWSHPFGPRCLVTLRACVRAYAGLHLDKLTPYAKWIHSRALDAAQGEFLLYLEEITDFILSDPEARNHAASFVNDDRHPHRCPICGAAAYIGYLQVECLAGCR